MKSLMLMLALLISPTIYAQTSTEKTHKSSYTHSRNNKVNSHTSVSRSKHYYKFDADFHATKNESVKQLITKRLGKKDMTVNGNRYTWQNSENSQSFFTCTLNKGTLHIQLDRQVAPDSFYKKINELGDDLQALITSHANHGSDPHTKWNQQQSIDPQLQQEELRQAQQELERAKRNLERIKAKQKKKDD